MVQRGQGPGFALESCEALRVVRKRVRKNLDGDLTAEMGIHGAPHVSHSANANPGGDLVGADVDSGCQWARETEGILRQERG